MNTGSIGFPTAACQPEAMAPFGPALQSGLLRATTELTAFPRPAVLEHRATAHAAGVWPLSAREHRTLLKLDTFEVGRSKGRGEHDTLMPVDQSVEEEAGVLHHIGELAAFLYRLTRVDVDLEVASHVRCNSDTGVGS